jgi:hypothetical protein
MVGTSLVHAEEKKEIHDHASCLLLSALTRFTGEQWEQEDDVTMVVLSKDASGAG